jgi:hypothetical protein
LGDYEPPRIGLKLNRDPLISGNIEIALAEATQMNKRTATLFLDALSNLEQQFEPGTSLVPL